MNARPVTHKYRGPRVSADGHTFAYACTCGDIGPERHSRTQAKADHQLHRTRQRVELEQDIAWDRDWGADL